MYFNCSLVYHLGEGCVLKTSTWMLSSLPLAYHLGEGCVLKTMDGASTTASTAYHLGEGCVLKTDISLNSPLSIAYHLGEGCVLKTHSTRIREANLAYHLGEGCVLKTANLIAHFLLKAYRLVEGCMLKICSGSCANATVVQRFRRMHAHEYLMSGGGWIKAQRGRGARCGTSRSGSAATSLISHLCSIPRLATNSSICPRCLRVFSLEPKHCLVFLLWGPRWIYQQKGC